MTTDPIVWQGDLDDDCHARWRGLGAHAERMDEHSWYCSVWCDGAGKKMLFHSSDDDIHPLTGKAARWLCELVLRAAVSPVRILPERNP